MLGTRTWGGRMVGADDSTELWRHPMCEQIVTLIMLNLWKFNDENLQK